MRGHDPRISLHLNEMAVSSTAMTNQEGSSACGNPSPGVRCVAHDHVIEASSAWGLGEQRPLFPS